MEFAEKDALRELDLALLTMRENCLRSQLEASVSSGPEASFTLEPEPSYTTVRDSGTSWATSSWLRPEPVSISSGPKASFTPEPEPTCTTVRDCGTSWTNPSSLRPEPTHHQKVLRATEAQVANVLRASRMSIRRDCEVDIIDESTIDPEILKEHRTLPPRKPPPRPTIYIETTQVTAMEINCSPPASCRCW